MAGLREIIFGKAAEPDDGDDDLRPGFEIIDLGDDDPDEEFEKRGTTTLGTTGIVATGGYITTDEREPKMLGERKWTSFQKMIVDISIIAAGLRIYLNLLSLSTWTVNPAEGEEGGQAQEIADAVYDIMFDHETPWSRIVKKLSLYRFYGFAILEWTAKQRDDGTIGMLDVESRPQRSITRWDVDEGGTVLGVWQTVPATGKEIYLPRSKLVYAVDDSLSDSPDGLGLLRQCLNPVTRLRGYKALEEIGYEQDLHGIPVARAPIKALDKQADSKGADGPAFKSRMLKPFREFILGHTRNRKQGVLIDSEPYRDLGENKSPSQTPKYDVSLLQSEGGSFDAINKSIGREIQEIARILGVEHLLLGADGSGSLAMAKSKAGTFYLNVTSAQQEIVEVLEADWLKPLCELNGWPEELWPELAVEKVSDLDIEQITQALQNISNAGVTLNIEDECVGELFDMLGLTRPDPELADDPAFDIANLVNPLDPNAPPIEPPEPANENVPEQPFKAKGKGVAKWVVSEASRQRAMRKRRGRGRA